MTAKPPRSWTVREATPDDFDAIRDLFRETWGSNRPDRYDRWRYLAPPGGFCPITLAVDGEKLVGAYIIWPAPLRIGREVVAGAQSMDTMTHPDFQGQGIFTTVANACFEIAAARGIRVLYGFPNPLSYPGFVRRLGWTHTGDVAHRVRPLRPSRHARVPAVVGPLADLAVAALPKGRRGGWDISYGRPEDDALEALISAWHAGNGNCGIARSVPWFDWRYADDAENDYEWVCTTRGGKLEALAIWGMRNGQWGDDADNRAHLVELLGQSDRARAAALSAALVRARQRGAMLIETICNDPDIVKALRRACFYAHRPAPLIVKKIGDGNLPIDVLDHANWRIMGGDIDTF